MKLKATFFGKTKLVKVELHNMQEGEIPDEYFCAEKPEDEYALSDRYCKDKKIAIVTQANWAKGEDC